VAKEQVVVIDEDFGLSGSGSGSVKHSKSAQMTAKVALVPGGIVLALVLSGSPAMSVLN